jgi:hypothetical protein
VDGKAIVAGVCSRGQVGKAYLVGKRTNLAEMLGGGPLVDSLRDVLATGGQEPVVVAVPVHGQPGGYISRPRAIGSAVKTEAVGVAQTNADIVVLVTTPGGIGTAQVSILINGQTSGPVAAAPFMPLGDTGATLIFPSGATLEEDAVFEITVRTAIGPVARYGLETSPMIAVEGTVLAGAELVVQIARPGQRNEGTYLLSTDGGDNYGKTRTIPLDGILALPAYGVSITFPDGAYVGGTTYTCNLLAPMPGIVDVMTVLERPLSLYDVEFIHVVGPTDAVDWSAAQAKAEELWNLHRPTYFKMEARPPRDGEDWNDYAAALLEQRAMFAGRCVQVCAQWGEITDTDGERRLRNFGGLQSGRVMSLPVQRSLLRGSVD